MFYSGCYSALDSEAILIDLRCAKMSGNLARLGGGGGGSWCRGWRILIDSVKPDLEQRGLIREADLARALGVSREDIRGLRKKHLAEKRHWSKKKNRVTYTMAGALRLKKMAGCGETTLQTEKEAGGALASEAGPEELVVVSVPARNLRVLVAQKKGGGLTRVQVRSNLKFMPGMKIRALPGGEWPDVYLLAGRCPRFRGRW